MCVCQLENMLVINCSSEAAECHRVQLIRDRLVSRERGTSEHIEQQKKEELLYENICLFFFFFNRRN